VSGLPFTKGHGTENDFVLVPDLDGTRGLTPEEVRLLADRRAGLGADGVIRVVPTRAADEPMVRDQAGAAEWFMDYRNGDGSTAQMCGNGVRVFVAYLLREGLSVGPDLAVATRAGVRQVRVEADGFAVDMGPWHLVDPATAAEHGFDAVVRARDDDELSALRIDVGNPHTVAIVATDAALQDLDLTGAPVVTPHPVEGTNVEFVHLIGPGHIRMRVHERGVGETRSCGTGACAAALATRWWAGHGTDDRSWVVEVPGGQVRVRPLPGGRVELFGPALLVADGVTSLLD
jgi:diaminopimelate epimerase